VGSGEAPIVVFSSVERTLIPDSISYIGTTAFGAFWSKKKAGLYAYERGRVKGRHSLGVNTWTSIVFRRAY